MKMFRNLLAIIVCLLLSASVNGQVWVDMMQDDKTNFYDIQREFNSYWENKELEKGKGWKQFRRWEYFMEQRLYPHGDRSIPSRAMSRYMQDNLRNSSAPKSASTANWTLLGPSGSIPTGGGAGRINAVRFHPTDTNTIFACAPAGGLWKSVNAGQSWSTNTDNLTVIGCSDVAIDPSNPNIMYLATGDKDAGDTYSIGILKSTDGGSTWNTTGLNWQVTQSRRIARILIHPTNTDTLLAATSAGIWRSVNGGTSWSSVASGNYKAMEFKPGDPTTVYASGAYFYRSTNGGTSFSQVTSGLPTSGVTRMAIAVTPANPNYVYILAGKSSDNGFYGLYRSINSGAGFSLRSNSPNLLGWSPTGSDSGGQAWYDLAIAASPVNADEIFTGGVNIWKSVNGGTSWTITAHWYGAGSVPYVHADIHDLIYRPGSSELFSGNDGGVFKTNNAGTSWVDLSDGLQIAQMYRLSTSTSSTTDNITGWQDNGTNFMSGTNWAEVLGGDGMECIIKPGTTSTVYGSIYYGKIYMSQNGGQSFSGTIVNSGGTGVDENGAWVTPYVLAPSNANTMFVGKSQVYKSTNSGSTFSQVGSVSGGTGKMVALAVAPSNINYIYAAKKNRLWVSTNGTSFTDRTSGLPVSSASITYIAIHPTNPLKAWVTFSGYTAANKVYSTTDGGQSWSNASSGLPNLPVNCIVYQNGSPDGLYVGTDVGVYYSDSQTSWTAYNTGLPNVVVSELEINYSAGKLRAATYGRGLWESSLQTVSNIAPIVDFTATITQGCPGTSIQFTDMSTYNPTSWSWTFQGGTPSTSTAQNPVVTFNSAGTYNVTLVATNANGSGTEVKSGYITITNGQSLPMFQSFGPPIFPPAGWVIENPDNTATWARSGTVGGFGTSSSSAYIDNFTDDLSASNDALVMPIYSTSGISSLTLVFDVAYARYSSVYSDTLAVLASYDCGSTYNVIYKKGGTQLATTTDQTSLFVPSSTNWRTDSINLTGITSSNVLIKFENIGGWGNVIYLDNINIPSLAPTAAYTVSPSIVCQNQDVYFTDQSANNPTSYSWTFQGGTPATSTAANPTVVFGNTGVQNFSLTASNGNGSDMITGTVTVNPSPSVPVVVQTGNVLTSSSSTGNQWFLNGNPITGATGQAYYATTSGNYQVMVTNSYGCSETSDAQQIVVGVEENSWANGIRIMPNPNQGRFTIAVSQVVDEDLRLEINDLAGKKVYEKDLRATSGENFFTIDNANLSKGSYLLTLTGSSGRGVKTVIVF